MRVLGKEFMSTWQQTREKITTNRNDVYNNSYFLTYHTQPNFGSTHFDVTYWKINQLLCG